MVYHSFVRFVYTASLVKMLAETYVKLSRMNLYAIVNVETVTEYGLCLSY